MGFVLNFEKSAALEEYEDNKYLQKQKYVPS